MFDEATARRLDRLEREASRRIWDSAVMTASQRAQFEPAAGAAALAPPAGDRPLVEILAERFERLERKNRRLEAQLGDLERGARRRRRAFLAATVVTVGLLGGRGALNAGFRAATGSSRGAAVAGASTSGPPRLLARDKGAPEGRPWITP